MGAVLALIPARSGSKSIPHKNIRLLQGKPLIAHSIQHALDSALIDRVLVSTDSTEYANIARQYGAEVPFLRPPSLAQDFSTDLEVFDHALTWLKEQEGYEPEVCVHLRPTYPFRNPKDIDSAIRILLKYPEIDSVRSVVSAPDTPFKMWYRSDVGLLTPVITTDLKDAYNLPRQRLPGTFLQNACIDVVRTKIILRNRSMTGNIIYGYVMDSNYDIDTEKQFERVLASVSNQEIKPDSQSNSENQEYLAPKTFCIDIDGVIASIVPDNEYDKALPIEDTVIAINYLYDAGHRIVLSTARGSATGIDWCLITEGQLKNWGVKYHELWTGKPAADYYVDDRGLTPEELKVLTSRAREINKRRREQT